MQKYIVLLRIIFAIFLRYKLKTISFVLFCVL